MFFSVPNVLTWTRILLIPVLIGIFYVSNSQVALHDKNLLATLIFLLASITDWLDGYIARKFNQTSKFGAFLDPVADKLMVTTALVILVWLDRVGVLVASIIIGRELAISALREWMAILGETKGVAVSFIGKLKTAAQMIAIVLLLYFDPIFGVSVNELGSVLIYIATVLTVWSMLYYLKRAMTVISKHDSSHN